MLFGVLIARGALAQPATADEVEAFYRLGSVEVLGDTPDYLEVGAGVFDIFAADTDEIEEDRSAAAYLELRLGEKVAFLGPAIGLMANSDGGVFGYGAVYAEVAYRPLVVTALAGLGGWAQGGSKDLGGVFQFRLGLGLAYVLPDRSRLGVRWAHISNAGLHDENPSEGELLATYALPF